MGVSGAMSHFASRKKSLGGALRAQFLKFGGALRAQFVGFGGALRAQFVRFGGALRTFPCCSFR